MECQPSLKSLDNRILQRYGKGQMQKDEHKVFYKYVYINFAVKRR